MAYNIAGNDQARLFLLQNGIFTCNVNPQYLECASIDSLAQDRGDITKIECPSPYRYGEFVEVYSFSGELSRLTTTLTTYMSQSGLSTFRKLFLDDCSSDLHLHFGLCEDPTDFTKYSKALVFEDVRVTSYGTDPLVALQSADRGIIQETVDISAAGMIEIVPLTYSEIGSAVTDDGPFVKLIVHDRRNCGTDCDEASDGCQRWFGVTDDGVLYGTEDGGTTWVQDEITTDGGVTPIADTPNDLVASGDYLVVSTVEGNVYNISWKEWFDDTTTSWDVVALDFNAMDTFFGRIYAVGDTGTVYSVTRLADATTLLNGSLTSENFNDVDVLSNSILVGGANGALVYSDNSGNTWTSVSAPTADAISSVLMKSERNWLIGTATGQVWCTDNSGSSWTRVQFPGWATASDPVDDIQMATPHIIYLGQNSKLYKSIDGGTNWVAAPEGSNDPFPTMAALNSIATCAENANVVMIGGDIGGTNAVIRGQ